MFSKNMFRKTFKAINIQLINIIIKLFIPATVPFYLGEKFDNEIVDDATFYFYAIYLIGGEHAYCIISVYQYYNTCFKYDNY
jgi:hypothetical protein